MTKRIEDALRDQLHRTGAEFDMDRSLPARVVRRSRQRRFRMASVVVAVLVVVAPTSAVGLRALRKDSVPVPAHTLTLADYLLASGDGHLEQSPGVRRPDDSVLEQVAACLRDHGFPVPDPTETDRRRQIALPDSIDPNSETWKEAAFVTCRPSKFDQSQDFQARYLSMPAQGVDDFISCMHDQGFDLPQPTIDDVRATFDLAGSGIDTNSDEWNRALFITCAPPPPPWPGGGSGSGSGGPPSSSGSGSGGSSSGSGSGSG